MSEKKVLVAFFSRAGDNYSVGHVATGNTEVLAGIIARQTGGDLFKIEPATPYPADYDECTRVAKREHEKNVRPDIRADRRIEDYDIIFIGYPNWWGDAPMPVYTFIDKHEWKGKTVIPFCTHEGSGLSNERQISAAVKGARLLRGLAMYGHTAQNDRQKAEADVAAWLSGLAL